MTRRQKIDIGEEGGLFLSTSTKGLRLLVEPVVVPVAPPEGSHDTEGQDVAVLHIA